MVLWDGSVHRWVGDEHPPCCLVSAIDDGTGRCLVARVFPFESSEGYLWVLRRMVREYGISPSIYQDRLAAELHRAGITDRERSNLFLEASSAKVQVEVRQFLDGSNFLDIPFSSYDNNLVIGSLKLTA